MKSIISYSYTVIVSTPSRCFHKYRYYLSQTSFSLYFHNQWTDSYKLSCAGKPQIRAICTYVGCTKATINKQLIRSSVTIKALFANIS